MQCRPLRRSQHNKRQLCRPTDQSERTYERNGERFPMNYSCAIIKPEKSIIPRDAFWLFLARGACKPRCDNKWTRACVRLFKLFSVCEFLLKFSCDCDVAVKGERERVARNRCCVLSLVRRTHTLTHRDNHTETQSHTTRETQRETHSHSESHRETHTNTHQQTQTHRTRCCKY